MQYGENKITAGHTTHRFPNLDALRGIAALTVVFYHICHRFPFPSTSSWDITRFFLSVNYEGGIYAVRFFFVLSAFLITYLAFNEKTVHGTLHLPSFYARRILRTWPLYFVSVVAGFYLMPYVFHLTYPAQNGDASLPMYLLFLSNFDNIPIAPDNGTIGVQWSVAVEEQFYLLWPLLFFIPNLKQRFPWIMAASVIPSFYFYVTRHQWEEKTYHFLSNLQFLAVGGLLGWAGYVYNDRVRSFFARTPQGVTFLAYVAGITVLYIQPLFDSRLLEPVAPLLFFPFVVAEQSFSARPLLRTGSIKPLAWLGRISYSLYLTHIFVIYFVLTVFSSIELPPLLAICLIVLISILLGALSYRLIEAPFLSLRKHFRARKDVSATPVQMDESR